MGEFAAHLLVGGPSHDAVFMQACAFAMWPLPSFGSGRCLPACPTFPPHAYIRPRGKSPLRSMPSHFVHNPHKLSSYSRITLTLERRFNNARYPVEALLGH